MWFQHLLINMLDEPIVIDDLISDAATQERIEKIFDGTPTWVYMPKTSTTFVDCETAVDAGQVVCVAIEQNQAVFKMSDEQVGLLEMLIDKIDENLLEHGLKISGVVRAKFNITFLSLKAHSKSHNIVHHDHCDDANRKFVSAIYYANESDGDTVFFDENVQESCRIAPEKGALVIFDSSQLHAGNNPRSFDTRKVINFIFHVVDA